MKERIEEATFQEDAPIYTGDIEADGYVRESVVKEIIRSHIEINDCGKCSRRKWYQKGYEDGKSANVKSNDGWIPVSERLPEEHDSIFKKFKGTHKWVTGMFEKESDKVNVTIEFEDGTRKTTTSYTLDGEWKLENRLVKMKVIAWKPFPDPYKGELNPEDTPHTCTTCRRYGRSDHNCYYCRHKERLDLWEHNDN